MYKFIVLIIFIACISCNSKKREIQRLIERFPESFIWKSDIPNFFIG